MENANKKPPPIKRKRLDGQILSLLNYKNQRQTKGIFWPEFIDDQTGEIGDDVFYHFPVNSHKYYEYFSQNDGPTGYTYYSVSRWYRYRPLLFQVDIMTMQVNRGLKKAIGLKNEELPADVKNAFDIPKLDFEYITSDDRNMTFREIQANLLDFYEFSKYETPKSNEITPKRFRACFEAFLEAMLHPQRVDLTDPAAIDKINF